MDEGRLIDFGKPIDLINDKSTILHDLVNSLDKNEASKLTQIARLAGQKMNDSEVLEKDEFFVDISLVGDENDKSHILFSDEEKEAFLSRKAWNNYE